MGVLDDCGDSYRTLPVGIVEALPVGELPKYFFLQSGGVIYDLVAGGSCCAGSDILSYKFKVVTFLNNGIGDYCS